jgi:quercetin dioxygenase-like cupin family protein
MRISSPTEPGREIDHFGSRGFTHRRLAASEDVHVSRVVLARGGRIGRHPATSAQLLVVVEGSGTVSGADGAEVAVEAGHAVLWEAGEEHETRTESGLVALVVEAESLRPPP